MTQQQARLSSIFLRGIKDQEDKFQLEDQFARARPFLKRVVSRLEKDRDDARKLLEQGTGALDDSAVHRLLGVIFQTNQLINMLTGDGDDHSVEILPVKERQELRRKLRRGKEI